jgi:hypothetical protein
MRKLVVMALALAGISQAAGCIFTSDEGAAFHGSWTITINGAAPQSAQDGCDALGAAKFSILSTDSLGNGVDDRFPCSRLEGTTGDLAPDTYTIMESMLDATDAAIPGTEVGPISEVLPDGTVVELDTVNYDIQTNAHIRMFVDYGTEGGSNCNTGGAMDSGVVQQQINVMDTTGQVCVDVTGTDQVGAPFQTDTCGAPALCMENTVAQEFDLQPGSYSFQVIGLKGATGGSPYQCYEVTGDVEVTGDSDVTMIVPFNQPDPVIEAMCNATKRDIGR